MTDRAKRVITGTLLVALAAIFVILICVYHARVFYQVARGDVGDAWRLLWLAPFVFGSLGIRAFLWQKAQGSPWTAYLLKYPVWTIAASWLVFAGCHSALKLDNWLYYATSALMTLMLSLAPGRALDRIRKPVEG